MPGKLRKIILASLTAFVLITQLFGSAQPARAQAVVAVAASVPDTIKTVLDKVFEGLKIAAINVASTAVGYALRKISYDAAVWIASGGKGQSALVYDKGFGDYLRDVANDAGGTAIDAISKQFGVNICKIPDPKIDLAFRTALRISYTPTAAPPKPSCTLSQFYTNNLTSEAWLSRFNTAEKSITQQFNETLNFDVSQGELGIALTTQAKINNQISAEVDAAAKQRAEGGGVKPLTDPVSGRVKSPASLVNTELQGISNKDRVNQSGQQIDTIISSGQWQLLPGALANFFLNTLAGTLIKNFQTQGILPFGICIGGAGGPGCTASSGDAGTFENAPGGTFSGRQAAEALFSDFLTVRIAQVDQYDILTQLNNCPTSGASLYNCRADSGLIQAAQEASNGTPLTLKEAVDKGFLRGDWKFIPPDNTINTDQNCYSRAYCYSNLKVLRQVRLLPLGFEIAAEKSNPDKPWSLSEVMAGFNDCDFVRDNTGKITDIKYDPINKPFCHLIDPDWIIKAPAARCNADVYGPTLLSSDAPNRAQTCADLSTCVGYNKDGTCINYAYCTRERNTWKFDADSCDAQYRTCRSFTDDQGNTKAYLYRSLNTAYCSKDTVGCRAYSLTQDSSGNWQSPTGVTGTNTTGIYFNNSVSLSCGAASAGCSAFQVADNQNTLLYLRKAPDYLKCYDSKPATPEIDIPQTRADLTRIQGRPECKDYANVCIPDEMNCNWYTPTNGGNKIPARYDASNICDAKCVGYAAYREMPNNYSNGQNLAYIIPSSGQSCTAAEEGCSAFTNLSTTSGGLEQVEYYSYLRSCSLPNPDTQKNFTTYEGTISGFQLKTYTLVKDETGGPQYFYRTKEDLAQYANICSQALYKAGTASLDCREFNDENGKVYYRLLSKTIPVDKQCTPYRLTSAELYPTNLNAADCAAQKGFFNTATGQCQLCFQNGEYRNGSCYYYGLPEGRTTTAGSSTSCTASVESCHAYKGDAGNNIRDIFTDTFDRIDLPTEWKGSGLAITNESVRVGGKSLGYTGNTEFYRNVVLTPGKSQEIIFWAKGTGQTITVALRSPDGALIRNFGQITVGDLWNQYKLGPIELSGLTTSSAQIVIKVGATGRLYLDNVNFKEVSDYAYLVKKSLHVDPVCDSNLTDNLPGEALGCSAYTDPSGQKVNLTSFNYLCRENAIGCTAVIDTHNTPDNPAPQVYNARLSGLGGTTASVTLGKDVVTCQIPGGETGCYVTITGHEISEIRATAGVTLTTSTVYISGTSTTTAPLYLVANQSATCNAIDLGCTYAGVQAQTPTGATYQITLVKNDPGSYSKTLCQAEAVGCKAYSSNQGTLYFKDPATTGNKICSYRTGVTVKGVKSDGWFWKGVGVCSNDQTKYCTSDQSCGTGNTCSGLGDQPCYPGYITDGNNYGLWSAGDGTQYQNFAGECPVEQDSCTEFVDHADNDRSYYLLKNNKISQGTCNGQVSQRAGCTLFDETDQPNKFYSSQATYDLSTANQFKPVQPVAGTKAQPGDSNLIIQVKRDRECGEWLQCRSSHRVWDEKTATWKMVCDAIGRCNKTPDNPQDDNISNCSNWVEEDPAAPAQVLNAEQYVKRDVSWAGQEFSGFSILNLFPLDSLTQVNVATPGPKSKEDWRLVHTVACGKVNCLNPAFPDEIRCKDNNVSCGTDNVGLCVQGVCMQGINGANKDVSVTSPVQTCRAYPEKDSPFPNSPFIKKAVSQFASANKCNETLNDSSNPALAGACECDYTKVTYGDIFTKFFAYDKPHSTEEVIPGGKVPGTVPDGICLGGSHDGRACSTDNDCFKTSDGKPYDPALNKEAKDGANNRITDGTCQKIKNNYKLLGWRGYCLEYDTSRTINGDVNSNPCLTWFPVDHLIGTPDIDNQHSEAGYQPPAITGGTGGAYYCLESNGPGGTDPSYEPKYPANRIFSVFDTGLVLDSARGKDLVGSGKAGQTSREEVSIPSTNPLTSFNQLDIERIEFKVRTLRDSEDPIKDVVFTIWPNDPTLGKPQAVYTTKGHDRAPGVAVTGKYLGKDNELILMYGSSIKDAGKGTYIDEGGKACYPGAYYGTALNDWGPNSTMCQDISGNIFLPLSEPASLKSRDTKTGADGLWDPAIPVDQLCGRYRPSLGVGEGYGGNWHAIRLVFDPQTREFKALDTLYCNQSGGPGAIAYDVTVYLRQWCHVVADTGSTITDAQNSAPWTNRLYQNAGFKLPTLDAIVNKRESPDFIYTYGNDQAPFGSLSINAFATPNPNPLFFTHRQIVQNCDTGTPCVENGLEKRTLVNSILTEGDTEKTILGVPYSCNGRGCVLSTKAGIAPASPLISGDRSTAGEIYLTQLFARLNKTFTYLIRPLPGQSVPVGYTGPGLPVDLTATANPLPKPPLVFPVGACDAENKCLEDDSAVGFSFNDPNKGTVSNGTVRFNTPSARVFMKFFMEADHNQMPIRNVTVDWGDGYVYPLDGLYQNHRGFKQATCRIPTGAKDGTCEVAELNDDKLCSTDAQCGENNVCVRNAPGVPFGKCLINRSLGNSCQSDTQCQRVETCQDPNDAKSFGKIKGKTCSSDYVQFDHVYQCYKGQPNNYVTDPAVCGTAAGCCVYVPKLQVRDNWGFCTGKCGDAGSIGREACYSKADGTGECQDLKSASIPFNGRIIVQPSSKK